MATCVLEYPGVIDAMMRDPLLSAMAAQEAHDRGWTVRVGDVVVTSQRSLGSVTVLVRLPGVEGVARVEDSEATFRPESSIAVGVRALLSGRPSSGAVTLAPDDVAEARAAILDARGAPPNVAVIGGVRYSTAPLADDPTPQKPSEIMAGGQTYDRRVTQAPATFWNGEPCQARRVRVVVGTVLASTWWCAGLEGTERDAVEVTYGGDVFYLDDEAWPHEGDGKAERFFRAGHAWRKVTEGLGSPEWAHRSLPDDSRVVGVRP